MISQIALTMIGGLPLAAYGGIITIISFLFTASIAIMNKNGINFIPFKWHPIMAITSITLAIIHGIAGLSIYMGW